MTDFSNKSALVAQDKLNALEASWVESILNEYIEPWLVQQVHTFNHPQYDFYLSMVRDVMDEQDLKVERRLIVRPDIICGQNVAIKRAGRIVAEKDFIISTREV